MISRTALLLLWLALVGLVEASPKIALVRVGEIYRSLPETQALEASVETEKAGLLRDVRADAYRDVLAELKLLGEGLAKIPKNDTANIERAQQNYALKRQEALTLQREFSNFRKKRTDEINARMVAEMEHILTRIHQKAAEIAETRGFDWVLDADGRTNTGLPFVLYAKEPHDITQEVMTALGGTTAETSDSN